eukprot:11727848-Ditylum_brightwellii.AAC.1
MERTNNNNDDDEYYSSDEDDSIYEPDDEDDESVNSTDADIAGVNEDETTGVPPTPEDTQDDNDDDNDDDPHSEPGASKLQRTKHVVPNDAQMTPDEDDRPELDVYNSKPWHGNEEQLTAETPAGEKRVKINMPATIIPQ